MFSVHCPRHDSEVLLGSNRIRSIARSGGTLTVHWECYCGHQGAHHRTIATPAEQHPRQERGDGPTAEDVGDVSRCPVGV